MVNVVPNSFWQRFVNMRNQRQYTNLTLVIQEIKMPKISKFSTYYRLCEDEMDQIVQIFIQKSIPNPIAQIIVDYFSVIGDRQVGLPQKQALLDEMLNVKSLCDHNMLLDERLTQQFCLCFGVAGLTFVLHGICDYEQKPASILEILFAGIITLNLIS
jgi:hypothetical protein